MGETKRTFIAIDLSGGIRARFDELQRTLQRAGGDVRWVRPERAHLTLKFLGDTTPEQIEAMARSLDEIGAGTVPFGVALRGLGLFPNEKRPRVLWIGITEGQEQIRPLVEAIEERAAALGFERERRGFSAHITLGRFRSPAGWDRLRELIEANRDFDAGRLSADAVHLIHSILSPQGPTYVPLHSAAFGTGR